MSNITFGQLPNQTSITATTIIPTVSANVNYTVTMANLQTYINGGNGNIISGNISVTGNVIANNFIGNGSYLSTLTGANIRGNISVTGNITSAYVLGNGSQLTGLPATYSNANVVSLMANFGSNAITTTGNVSAGNISATGNLTTVGTTTLNTYIETTAAAVNTSTSFTPLWSNGPVQRITANSNFTLQAPSGMLTGSSITLIITQDATGNRTMTPNAAYKFAYGVKTLSTAVSSTDVMSIFYTGSSYLCNLVKGYV